MTIGIYSLYWEGQDKVYIGQSASIELRYKKHIQTLLILKHSNYKVQDYYNKFGVPKLSILEVCKEKDLDRLEVVWTDEFDSLDNGLNIITPGTTGGRGVTAAYSKYSKRQVLKVFAMILRSNLTKKYIADRAKVKESFIGDITTGMSHSWLKDEYPDKFNYLKKINAENRFSHILEKRGKPKASFISPTGVIYKDIGNISDFARSMKFNNVSSASKSLNAVYNNTKSAYMGWKKAP